MSVHSEMLIEKKKKGLPNREKEKKKKKDPSSFGSLLVVGNLVAGGGRLKVGAILTSFSNSPFSSLSDTMIMDSIAAFLVLPNRLLVPLVPDLQDVAQLRSPLPRVWSLSY